MRWALSAAVEWRRRIIKACERQRKWKRTKALIPTGAIKRKPECGFWRVMSPTQTETVDSRRYEWSVSGMNEQILVKIRSGATLLHKLYFYWFDRRKKFNNPFIINGLVNLLSHIFYLCLIQKLWVFSSISSFNSERGISHLYFLFKASEIK